jgi:hypothetical protein
LEADREKDFFVVANATTFLKGTLGDVEGMVPIRFSDPKTSMKEVSRSLLQGESDCALCQAGIVTPWDVIIKPWEQNKLGILN